MKITAHEIKKLTVEPGGHRFTEFVDSLIRTEAAIHKVPFSALQTNLKTNVGDKGVDTSIEVPILSPRADWMKIPTVWQYKATNYGALSTNLERELRKENSASLILAGYGYRLAVCDSIPAPTVVDWEGRLTEAARELNPSAPEAQVLTADDLADWANQYPAILIKHFNPLLNSICLHMAAWSLAVQSYTPAFVEVHDWQSLSVSIQQHCDLAVAPTDVIFAIVGETGVGKTRLVYEALKNHKLDGLLLYTDDEEHAKALANIFANSDSSCKAVLIADESSPATREGLRRRLDSVKDRIRVIAIESGGIVKSSLSPEHRIIRPTRQLIEKILEANFPEVSMDRRATYAKLCDGFIQPAADLCRNDATLIASRNAPITSNIRDYFHRRLTQEELQVVRALSLFSKIGFKDEVAGELDQLCSLVHLDRMNVEAIAHRLHDRPGFVNRAGRYFRVSPQIIAQMAFDEAWNIWIQQDPEGFFKSVAANLVQRFADSASQASEEVNRRIAGDFFLKWATSVSANDLANPEAMDRMVALVEMHPELYLPLLARVIEEASDERLVQMSQDRSSGWSPRRRLIFLLERIASFENTFDLVEKMLYRLAQCETEPKIGNNSTNEWARLFHVLMSGTPEPFGARFERLKERVNSERESQQPIALSALGCLIESYRTETAKDTVVGGRITPPEWQPKTELEYRKCFDDICSFFVELHQQKEFSDRIAEIFLSKTDLLLQMGYLEAYRSIMQSHVARRELQARILVAVEDFIHFHESAYPESEKYRDYIQQIRDWIVSITPTDFHGRLVSVVGIHSWQRIRADRTEIAAEIARLAQDLLKDQKLFQTELPWLTSTNAQNGWQMGLQLGEIDKDGTYLDLILGSSTHQDNSTSLAAGYVFGLLQGSSAHVKLVNDRIDQLQESSPRLAYDIVVTSRKLTNGFERTLELVRSKKLEISFLRPFMIDTQDSVLTVDQTRRALELVIERLDKQGQEAADIGIDLLGAAASDQENAFKAKRLADPNIEPLVWIFLEHPCTQQYAAKEAYWWHNILAALISQNPAKVAKLATDALVSRRLSLQEKAVKVLIAIGEVDNRLVLKQLKRVMLDENVGWHFFIGNYKELFAALDQTELSEWIESEGIEIAKRCAKHLPRPFIAATGEAVVPAITEFVLERFGDDQIVFSEFMTGAHGEVFRGSAATRSEQDAELAKKFLSHRSKKIREWAAAEIERAKVSAQSWRQFEEEMDLWR